MTLRFDTINDKEVLSDLQKFINFFKEQGVPFELDDSIKETKEKPFTERTIDINGCSFIFTLEGSFKSIRDTEFQSIEEKVQK
jgi:hypothetical protein